MSCVMSLLRSYGSKITGLRPGEKLYEELLIGKNPHPTVHASIMQANEEFVDLQELLPALTQLQSYVDGQDANRSLQALKELVPDFIHRSLEADAREMY